jgi:hypothetical protein
MMTKIFLPLALLLGVARTTVAQSTLHNYLPYYWTIYDFATSYSAEESRARDAIVTHAPKNNNQVIDTMFYYSPNSTNAVIFKYANNNLFNKYDSRQRLVGGQREFRRNWSYSVSGEVVSDYELDFDTDTSLFKFRIHTLHANGLIEQIYYGYDTATVDTFSEDYGLANYHYTGMRLDSSTYSNLIGWKRGTEYYYYSGSRFDSIIYKVPAYPSGYFYISRNYFTYNASGNLIKDSASYVWPGTSSYDNIKIRKWFYAPNGNLDSAYWREYESSGIITGGGPTMRYYYNADNNYDSIVIGRFNKIRYVFSYQASAFNTIEYEVSNTFQPYPNPINNGAILRLEGNTRHANLYALDGKLVKNYARLEEDQLVLPNNLPPGLYILQWQVQGSTTPQTQKLLIKN